MKRRKATLQNLNGKQLQQIRAKLLDIRKRLSTDDEVFLIKFDKELIRAVDALDTLLFLSTK